MPPSFTSTTSTISFAGPASPIHWHLDEANEDARLLLPRMETDVCLRRDGRAIILDTKFYAEALKGGS